MKIHILNHKFILLLSVLLIFFIPFVLAGTQHGVNGFVSNCGFDINVNNASVEFRLVDSNLISKSSITLNDIVGEYGKSGKSGWYAIDAGNFDDVQWMPGDIVLITISKDDYTINSNVTLTDSGNDQAFMTCLVPPYWEFICACGNNICENWKPLCETYETCPDDCSPGFCGDGEISADEQCDGNNWGQVTGCEYFGFGEGTLQCIGCSFDTSLCGGTPGGICGDGIVNLGELCDMDNWSVITGCNNFDDFKGGHLQCVNCSFDTSLCTGGFVPSCPDGICQYWNGEDMINCPDDCHSGDCPDGICQIERGENYITCPDDCPPEITKNLKSVGEFYDIYGRCGDKKCELAETQKNCCTDCGCPDEKLIIGSKISKCLKNKCVPQCCLFGICCTILTCWYAWPLTAILLIALIIYLSVLKKRRRRLSKKIIQAKHFKRKK